MLPMRKTPRIKPSRFSRRTSIESSRTTLPIYWHKDDKPSLTFRFLDKSNSCSRDYFSGVTGLLQRLKAGDVQSQIETQSNFISLCKVQRNKQESIRPCWGARIIFPVTTGRLSETEGIHLFSLLLHRFPAWNWEFEVSTQGPGYLDASAKEALQNPESLIGLSCVHGDRKP